MNNRRHGSTEWLCTLDIYGEIPIIGNKINGEVKKDSRLNASMLLSPALYEVGFATLAAVPYLKHGFDLFMGRKRKLIRPEQDFTGTLTILLPMWNEAKILIQKLENLQQTTQAFKPHLVIIDSASTDDSVSLAEHWEGKGSFASYHLLRMDERKGKTAAVKQALSEL